jgi:hypothetical protein
LHTKKRTPFYDARVLKSAPLEGKTSGEINHLGRWRTEVQVFPGKKIYQFIGHNDLGITKAYNRKAVMRALRSCQERHRCKLSLIGLFDRISGLVSSRPENFFVAFII